MLTVVTGVPGAGKTLLTLERLLKEFRSTPEGKARPIYVNGIPDLDYGYFGAQELKEPEKWYELPEGSVIVVDEAQRVFPQRPASVEVPRKCREFETHRHRGFDVFLTTQDATTLDVHVRKLCGRHFHVHRILGRKMATVYEFDHYQSSPTGFHEKKTAISVSGWTYPKKLFERYKSATMHTYKARTPWKLYAIPVVAVFALFMMYRGISGVGSMAENMEKSTLEAVGMVPGQTSEPGSTAKGIRLFSKDDWFTAYQPTVRGVLHTAPVFGELVKPKTFPRPFCMIYDDGRRCRCNSQQGTLYRTTTELCMHWAMEGFFDVTADEEKEREGAARAGRQALRAPSHDSGEDIPRFRFGERVSVN